MVATPRHKEFILYFTFVPSFYLLRLFFLRQFSTSSLVFRRRRSSFLRPRKEIEHRYTRTHVCSRLFPKVVTNQRHWRNARLNTNHVAPGFDWKPIGLSLSFSPPPPPSRSFSLSLGNVSEQSFTVAYSTAVHFDVFFFFMAVPTLRSRGNCSLFVRPTMAMVLWYCLQDDFIAACCSFPIDGYTLLVTIICTLW